MLVQEEGATYMAGNDGDSDDARTLWPLQAAACTYRIAFGPRAGQKVLTVRCSSMERGRRMSMSMAVGVSGSGS